MRSDFPDVTFREGYIGASQDVLPDDYFDLVYSVSVIEHVPESSLPDFHADLLRILRPGGVQIHSYDVPWGRDYSAMVRAVESAGFEWLEPRTQWLIPWVTEFTPTDVSLPTLIARTIFEHPAIVLDVYSHKVPQDQRRLWNWTSIFMGARKPLIG